MEVLELGKYSELTKIHRIFNLAEVGYKWALHIPDDLAPHIQLYDIAEILPQCSDSPQSYQHMYSRDCMRPWIDILTECLDTAPGKHIYKLSFVDTYTDDQLSLYFTYTIQQDNPDQDYVYMERRGDNHEKDNQ